VAETLTSVCLASTNWLSRSDAELMPDWCCPCRGFARPGRSPALRVSLQHSSRHSAADARWPAQHCGAAAGAAGGVPAAASRALCLGGGDEPCTRGAELSLRLLPGPGGGGWGGNRLPEGFFL